MALIKCGECGHEVSERASACPNCGCPIEKGNCCIECGQPIPDGVNECPNCGCPIGASSNPSNRINTQEVTRSYDENYGSSNKRKLLYVILPLVGGALVGGTLLTYLMFNLQSRSIDQQDSGSISQRVEDSIANDNYYAIIYNDNTGGFYTPNGGRICGLKLRKGRKEPLTLDLNSTFLIMGNNSDNLYVTMERAFSDYSDFLSYYNEYAPDKSLGVDVTRMEKDGVFTIIFDFQDGQIDKFEKPAIKIEANDNNEYTAIYYDDETGDLFDDDGSHICGLKKGFGGTCEYTLQFSKTVTIYGAPSEEVLINGDKVYVKLRDFLDDRMAFDQQESKAKAKVRKEESGNATIFHFSKTASSQGLVGKESPSQRSHTSSSAEWNDLSLNQIASKLNGSIWTCRPVGKQWYRLEFHNGSLNMSHATPSLGYWLEDEQEWRYEMHEGFTSDTGEKCISAQIKKPRDELSYGALIFFKNGDVEFNWLRGKEGGKAECKDYQWK